MAKAPRVIIRGSDTRYTEEEIMDDYNIVKGDVEVSVEVIKRVWTNLKNWNCWDFSDFRLTKEEGETVEKVLKLFLEALPFLEEDKDEGNI